MRRALLRDLEQRPADLREQMDVLMAVDEIRRAAEGVAEGVQLVPDLGLERVVLEAAQRGVAECCRKRQEMALVQRPEARAQWPERRGERHMQPDRYPRR